MKPLVPQKGFESLPSGPKIGKYGLAILRTAGVQIDVLETDEKKLKPEENARLGDKRAKLESALEEVNKMLEPVKVG